MMPEDLTQRDSETAWECCESFTRNNNFNDRSMEDAKEEVFDQLGE